MNATERRARTLELRDGLEDSFIDAELAER